MLESKLFHLEQSVKKDQTQYQPYGVSDKTRVELEQRALFAQAQFPLRAAQPRRITPLELEMILRRRPDVPRRTKENYTRLLIARNPDITVGELSGAIDRYRPGVIEAQIEDLAKQRGPELWSTAAAARRILQK